MPYAAAFATPFSMLFRRLRYDVAAYDACRRYVAIGYYATRPRRMLQRDVYVAVADAPDYASYDAVFHAAALLIA